MPFLRPTTVLAWHAARRKARRQIALRSALLLAQGLLLAVGYTPIMGALTGPEKGLWLTLATANFFWAILAVEHLLELRPVPADERAGVIQREGEARVQARETPEVPLLALDDAELAQERWRGLAH